MQSQQQTILVVEDELPHLDLLRSIFETAGYLVFTAKDGIEAKELYEQHQDDIDLVLCDVALPELGGWTVYQALKDMNPNVKMVLTSGYLDSKVKSIFVSGGVRDFIAKPYDAETILHTVKQALS